MGRKFVIELMDGPVDYTGGEEWFMIKGLPGACWKLTDIEKLEKYDPEKEYDRGYEQGFEAGQNGYEQGLADAWKAARKISCYPPDGFNMIRLREIFGKPETGSIMKSFSATEAIAKIEAYEEKQKAEIRVGDEVQISIFTDTYRGVVLRVSDKMGTKLVSVIRDDGFSTFDMRDIKIEKTGRHFPQVAELLEKMKEVEE